MMLGEKCYLAEDPYEAERRVWDFVSKATWMEP